MLKTIDATTFGGLSVAHYVAMKELSADEIKAIQQKDRELLERVSLVMSRVSFVDELRYSVSLDLGDLIQCIRRDALEIYLLCTCLDTLAGRANYFDVQTWLRTEHSNALGIAEKRELLKTFESEDRTSFMAILSKALDIYNKYYGVNQNVRAVIQSLPAEMKTRLASAYTIFKQSDPQGKENWEKKTVEEKLKTIFVDYLFQYRRNLYTHKSRSFPNFGGIRVMREALREGNVELPLAETHQLSMEKDFLSVTCQYGDEALFVREVIIACLADKLGVLSPDWTDMYRKAEQQKRMLQALLYELKYNIQILQLHLQVLSEPIILKTHGGSPKLEIKICQSLLDGSSYVKLPMDNNFLSSYIQAATEFNNEIEKTGANTKYHMETTSGAANELMTKFQIRYYGQILGRLCEKLLEDFPLWTYTLTYFPVLSSF